MYSPGWMSENLIKKRGINVNFNFTLTIHLSHCDTPHTWKTNKRFFQHGIQFNDEGA